MLASIGLQSGLRNTIHEYRCQSGAIGWLTIPGHCELPVFPAPGSGHTEPAESPTACLGEPQCW